MNLYTKYAKQFSQTRQNPWKGWEQVVAELKTKAFANLNVLDLGCGNGRFLKYLAAQEFVLENYLGVDNSNLLLAETKKQIDDFKTAGKLRIGGILKQDLNAENWNYVINENFELVACFGLMHHINPFETRKAFLKNAFELVAANGFLAVSYWQFGALARYENKKTPATINAGSKYSENDFILNFGDSKAERFCHFVSSEELSELEEGLGFSEAKTFVNDGKEANENIYRIYFK